QTFKRLSRQAAEHRLQIVLESLARRRVAIDHESLDLDQPQHFFEAFALSMDASEMAAQLRDGAVASLHCGDGNEQCAKAHAAMVECEMRNRRRERLLERCDLLCSSRQTRDLRLRIVHDHA